MQLDTARGVKQDIRSFIATDVVRTRGEDAAKAISIGFAPTARANDYAIAVRARSEENFPPMCSNRSGAKRQARSTSASPDPFPSSGRQLPRRHGIWVSAPPSATIAVPPVRSASLHAAPRTVRSESSRTTTFWQRRIAAKRMTTSFIPVRPIGAAGRRTSSRGWPAITRASRAARRPSIARSRRSSTASRSRRSRWAPAMNCRPWPAVPSPCPPSSKSGGHRPQAGQITAFDIDNFSVDYSFGRIQFEGLIEIESEISAAPFARPGDSGSLVFNAEGQPLGLLFVSSLRGGAHNCGLAYATPIDTVLSALGVTFIA